MTLQALRSGKAIPVVSHLGQEPRRQLRASAGEGPKQIMIGMLAKECFNGGAISEKLPFQSQ